ncbi:hypothetical protein I7I51_03136 [Histoplasma capsulatum]|uniref:Uncharacterized protein n=1 Tax=Ajellomyces capsulatus TaxID=5037 RepID=A0A8A1MQ69_AJECA|nr:predicted protein [Histoplasma mississippiense (nom. inval.)]EDN11152.1 predicted protein [Histoplasma mississippiense (nom. inval.)]QSS66924.1 hypothetical protein I7I51_03136 [Histoplasma capsulatum]
MPSPSGTNKPYYGWETLLLLQLKGGGYSWTEIFTHYNRAVSSERQRSIPGLKGKLNLIRAEYNSSEANTSSTDPRGDGSRGSETRRSDAWDALPVTCSDPQGDCDCSLCQQVRAWQFGVLQEDIDQDMAQYCKLVMDAAAGVPGALEEATQIKHQLEPFIGNDSEPYSHKQVEGSK